MRKPLHTMFPTIDNEINRISQEQDNQGERINQLTQQLEQLNNSLRKAEKRKPGRPRREA